MTCENQVGVKNILITFRNCATGQVFGPLSHQLSSTDLPTIRTCAQSNDPLPGGFVKRNAAHASIEMKITRDLRIPLALYQGCSSMDVQVEYDNGLLYTGLNGTGTGDGSSDTHEVDVTAVFKAVDEMLPGGQLQSAA